LITQHIEQENLLVSGIANHQELLENLKANCVPTEIIEMGIEDYQEFLVMRRKLMSQKIKEYYFSL
jgi:hypothetical protein